MRDTRRDAGSGASGGEREAQGAAATPGKATLVGPLPQHGGRGAGRGGGGAAAAGPQGAAAPPGAAPAQTAATAGDGQSGTIERVGGEPGEGSERGAGEGSRTASTEEEVVVAAAAERRRRRRRPRRT